MRLVLLVLLPLSACGGGTFDLRGRSCRAPVTELSRGLTFHVLQGTGDGSFYYSPGGAQWTSIAGDYDLVNGDFSFDETFSDLSFKTGRNVTGYGYADVNGDLDIVGRSILTDVRGVVNSSTFRVERTGCETTLRTRWMVDVTDEREQVEHGTYESDVYRYDQTIELEDGEYVVEGERTLDRDWNETISYSGSYSYEATREGNLAEGGSTTAYEQQYTGDSGPVTIIGQDEKFTDGGTRRTYTQSTGDGDFVWDYTLDFDGDGTGTVKFGDNTCDLRFDAGQCNYNCGDGWDTC